MVRLVDASVEKRDTVMQQMLEKNISTRRAIMAIHREVPYRSERWEKSLPKTDIVTDTALILPLFHDMTEADQDYIIETLYTTAR
jgi:dTDP-4-amino-4,6-dideoxygalactose transaminase